MHFRVVKPDFWTDTKVIDKFSVEDKYFFLYLLTNPHTNLLGIYTLPIKVAAFECGYSPEQVVVLLDRFENKLGVIKYNRDTQEVAIGNYLIHSIVSGGPPVMKQINSDLNSVKDSTLVEFVVSKMEAKSIIYNNTIKDILYILNSYTKELFNMNTYKKYGVTGAVTGLLQESCPKPTKHKALRNCIPPTLEQVADYCDERGNGVDPEAFIDFYTSKDWFVGKNKMKDWQAAVRNWERHNNNGKANNKPRTTVKSQTDLINQTFGGGD